MTGGLTNNSSCTISFTVTAGAPGSGIVNPATRFDYTRSGAAGSNTSTNLAPVTVVPYTVNKTSSTATVNGQADLTYTVAIQNLSATTVLDLDQVQDSLPNGFIYVKGSARIGAAVIADPVLTGTNANQILTWDLTGTAVAASATANLTYRVAVSSTTTGNKTNTATVDAAMSADQLLGLRHRDRQRRHPPRAALGDEPGRPPRGRPDAAEPEQHHPRRGPRLQRLLRR